MAEYTYDEEGFNFLYFLLSVVSIALIPTTLYTLYTLVPSAANKKKNLCQCAPCRREREKFAKTNTKKKNLVTPKAVFLVLGWIAFGLLAYQVSKAETKNLTWDPYDILGISEGAEMAEIKKVYRKLSLVYHPDKAPEEFAKEYEEKFIQISKAYQVLTDDDIRKNYEEFGHPDGKQSFSMGVALPRALVESGNNKWVLAFYALAFGLGLPYYIAQWWNRSRRQTKDKILNTTMGTFVKGLKENDDLKNLISLLSKAQEFKESVAYTDADAQALKRIDVAIIDELDQRFGEKFDRDSESVPGSQRKARTLLYAYLLRIDLASKNVQAETLVQDQLFIVERSVHLMQGLLQIATVKQWLTVAVALMNLQQDLLQALYPGDASIKQLPHVQQSLIRRYTRMKKKQIRSVQQMLDLDESERKSYLSPLNQDDYLDVIEVAQRIPRLSVKKAVFKVIGDKIITTAAIITFVLKLKNGQVQDVEIRDYNDSEDEDEFDEQGETKNKDDKEEVDEANGLPVAHTPYYPGEKKPYWWIFLGDPKVNRILVPPRKVTDIVDEKTIRVPFAGPPKAGTYTFSLFVKSDTYAGTDILQDIQLTVKEPSALPEEDDVDDSISDPEEDSIAGQMKLMREQGLASALAGGSAAAVAQQSEKKKKKKKQLQEEDDIDSSDSDSDDDE
ncbi:Sec63 Brl domain-containing protein [Gongronella butleri]|nr:Sec63 Brl domain-containing protein [Gongronella butleri]